MPIQKTSNTLKAQLSGNIKIASFIATIMVLFRHSLNYLAFFNSYEGKSISNTVENSFTILTEIAVPYFFIVSGFFFLRNNYYNSSYITMIRNKIKSLFIPFIIWNIWGAFILLLYNKESIGSFIEFINSLFMSNWNAPLWYIRDLMLIMLLYPIYGWLFVRKNKLFAILFLFILILYWKPADMTIISSEGLFFFMLGGLLYEYQSILNKRVSIFILIPTTFIWFTLSIYHDVCLEYHAIHKLLYFIGLFSFWGIIKYIPQKHWLFKLTQYSFLIYVMHIYIMKVLKNTVARFFFGNDIAATITYIVLPFVVATIIIIIGNLWRNFYYNSYKIATGGR
ncbi:acyltransferase family protein [Phocaeicola plebeius]|uniref:acyltransferase family protein n=1 Tax=Phocaeicola plebeius TaxID=310297 RepID=UPI00350E3AD9